MKQAILVGISLGGMVILIFSLVAALKASGDQWERDAQAFRAACDKVKGVAVWNNKYWECLK